MNTRRISALIGAILIACSLTSCGESAEVTQLKNIEALNAESNLTNVNLSASEKEAAIYSQVSDRKLLDLATLDTVPENDKNAVETYMDLVDAQLTGSVSVDNGIIDKSYTDYLLAEFEKTPFYWQRASMNIRGMDSASRNIVVDVTYKTIDFNKTVKPASTIVLGEPDYETKLEVRYKRWMSILAKRNKEYRNDKDAQRLIEEEAAFAANYGNIQDILDAQRNLSPTEAVFETGNQLTYTGLVNHEQEKVGATMTVRYILVPNYTMGINQGYACKHLYVTSYKLDKDTTEGRALYQNEDSMAVVDNVYNVLLRYYKCIDEANFNGLYRLVNNFGDVDKYYSDYFDTTYRHNGNFTLSVFDIKNTTVECGVTLSRKVRAKGSNISAPIYTDRYYYVLDLVDGELKINEEVLLSSTLEGEPAVGIENADTTGFSSSVSLTSDDKRSIEDVISRFGAQQLLADTSSDGFADLIDMSLSNSQTEVIKSSMLSVAGKAKAVWLVSYLQGHNGYASVKCRELVQDDTGKISELETIYEFINKGSKWVIYDYQIASRVALATTEMTVKNALCICSPGSVDSLISQVETSDSEEETESKEAVGVVVKYNTSTPVLKTSGGESTAISPDDSVENVEGVVTEDESAEVSDEVEPEVTEVTTKE